MTCRTKHSSKLIKCLLFGQNYKNFAKNLDKVIFKARFAFSIYLHLSLPFLPEIKKSIKRLFNFKQLFNFVPTREEDGI